ncbi:hypothetical protein ABT297_36300 [Dactylosporangium sp. NPDC000555]|uniref:hypothetical protein n=1 Tax=Dactylosporangium sp. NPDC000555 TaxID=3154260 RepID=UPI0033232A8D
MIDGAVAGQQGETLKAFLRRGTVVVLGLAALAGLSVYLMSRSDERAVRGLCTTAVRTQTNSTARVESVARTGDDGFLVDTEAGGQHFTCLVTREPIDDRWEVASVSRT